MGPPPTVGPSGARDTKPARRWEHATSIGLDEIELGAPTTSRRQRDTGFPLHLTDPVRTVGRRSGQNRRVEIWYVIIDGQIVVTGTPGARDWLVNLRDHPEAVLHLREPSRHLPVIAEEVSDQAKRRRLAEEARRIQPWYADQPYSIEAWVAHSPIAVLVPAPDAS